MNIQKINNLSINSNAQISKKQNHNKYINNSINNHMQADTVSFRATAKMLASRTNGINMQLAREINQELQPMQNRVRNFLYKHFEAMLATPLNPEKSIQLIANRAKTPDSIVEKSATRLLTNKEEVLTNLTDLNGGKLVLRDGGKQQVEEVLTKLTQAIKNKEVELIEIENKRPGSLQNNSTELVRYDYATEKTLTQLKKTQEKIWHKSNGKNKEVHFNMNDFTHANYMAIHLLLKLPGEVRPFELIILGKNVNALKDLDDILYKILNNKNVKKKYKPIEEIVKPLTEPANAKQKKAFDQYRGEAFLYQRLKKPTAYTQEETKEYFLPLSCDLPPEFDLNYLHDLMHQCDVKAQKEANSTTHKIKKLGKAVTSKLKQAFAHNNHE